MSYKLLITEALASSNGDPDLDPSSDDDMHMLDRLNRLLLAKLLASLNTGA
jgi:hypothetical protein